MKKSLPILLSLFLLFSCTQNLLLNRGLVFYSEERSLVMDSIPKIELAVFYNRPNWVDEEFSHSLSIKFQQPFDSLPKRKIEY